MLWFRREGGGGKTLFKIPRQYLGEQWFHSKHNSQLVRLPWLYWQEEEEEEEEEDG